MRPTPAVRLSLIVAFLLLAGAAATFAEDAWVQVKSPNFTVIANGGEKRARDVALQFERYRSAIQAGWPWARVQFERPIVILAAKDEATMKMLAPQFWEKGTKFDVASVFSTGADAYYIALRSDVRAADRPGSNPYQASYWSYTALALSSAFEHPLPLWFRNGLAAVLSNSIVRDTQIQFGQPLDSAVRLLQSDGRLRMAEFLAVDAKSPYYTSNVTRENFDAESWGVMHYLLFGRPDDRADHVNEIAKLLLEGKSSADAVQQVFGSLAALDTAYFNYVKTGVFRYAILKTPTDVRSDQFTVQPLAPPAVAAMRARYHVAMNRPADARALIAQQKQQPAVSAGTVEAEAILLDREGNADDARVAYARAVASGSESFFTFYRLATLEWTPNGDAAALAREEMLLRRSIELNDRFAPAHTFLADILTNENHAPDAIASAKRAATLAPTDAQPRLALARALWRASRLDEAHGQVLAARTLADSERERAEVQAMLDALTRAQSQTTR